MPVGQPLYSESEGDNSLSIPVSLLGNVPQIGCLSLPLEAAISVKTGQLPSKGVLLALDVKGAEHGVRLQLGAVAARQLATSLSKAVAAAFDPEIG